MDGLKKEKSTASTLADVEAIEYVGMLGCGLYFGWMLCSFFWLYAETGQILDIEAGMRDIVQSFIFAGFCCGFCILMLLAKKASFNLLKRGYLLLLAVLTLVAPIAGFFTFLGIRFPLALHACCCAVTGITAAALVVCWLDVCGRLSNGGAFRFVSFSLCIGALFACAVVFLPNVVRVFALMAYSLVSVLLLVYTNGKAPLNKVCPDPSKPEIKWAYSWEIAPSCVVFCVVFGLDFSYLSHFAYPEMLAGCVFVLPGALIIAILACRGKEIGITLILRVMLCVTAVSCIVFPIVPVGWRLVLEACPVSCWAAFVSIHYASLIEKTKSPWESAVFRQIPRHMIPATLGFLAGWIIAAAVSLLFGPGSLVFEGVRLGMAVILVVIFAVFMPIGSHHDDMRVEKKPSEPEEQPSASVGNNAEHLRIFDAKCDAVANLYQLSPREREILRYLARGRNSTFLQEKFTISPHTVKSHIYNIYKKLDIHSQQKLMDFVENYPLSEKELNSYLKNRQ